MNIVIPAAGEGKRFVDAGYAVPKPFLPINGIPMIQLVVDNISKPTDMVYILMRTDHLQYIKGTELTKRDNVCFIIVDDLTEGAACTVLKARGFINNETSLIIANSDQYMKWSFDHESQPQSDAVLFTFRDNDPKWSFVEVSPGTNTVVRVAEKEVISNIANTGVFWWRAGCDFVSAAEEMIASNDRVGYEFYVAPAMNYLIKRGASITHIDVQEFWGLGTPEDYDRFVKYHD